MKKIAVVYWSGGGNTEAMAKAVADGANKACGEAALFRVDGFSVQDMKDYNGFLFGCPAMGAEVL
ncbi:MAG: flavodoxin domain-containing protein, partial [Schwartzia sp.]|nr:flavodoxin domain-containing protein [Schwartzia sp. (in: firmicutes)]